MSRFPSWLLKNKVGMRQPDVPEVQEGRLRMRLNAMQRTTGRRLSDRVETVFEEACLAGDFETAGLLLAAIEHQYRKFADNRRVANVPVARLREHLTMRKAASGHI
jgi:hypothetical protein